VEEERQRALALALEPVTWSAQELLDQGFGDSVRSMLEVMHLTLESRLARA